MILASPAGSPGADGIVANLASPNPRRSSTIFQYAFDLTSSLNSQNYTFWLSFTCRSNLVSSFCASRWAALSVPRTVIVR